MIVINIMACQLILFINVLVCLAISSIITDIYKASSKVNYPDQFIFLSNFLSIKLTFSLSYAVFPKTGTLSWQIHRQWIYDALLQEDAQQETNH